ncbi:MAG: metallophosphoesterase [Leptospirales bacterium]
MKIQFASDLHTEFGGTPIRRNHLVGDVLVLAGDIAGTTNGLVDYLNRLHTNRPILYVVGNHEYYGGNWDKAVGLYSWAIEKAGLGNVHLLENDAIEIGGIRFLGTTLWTDCMAGEQGLAAEAMVADFLKIEGPKNTVDTVPLSKVSLPPGYVPSRAETLSFLQHMGNDMTKKATLSWQAMAERYHESLEWLKQEIVKPFPGKTVVVTHFAPSLESNAAEYADSPIRGYFCNDLDSWIEGLGDRAPEIWIHGHTHHCVDYRIGKTRVVSNQNGYLGIEKVEGFDPTKTVEI